LTSYITNLYKQVGIYITQYTIFDPLDTSCQESQIITVHQN